MFRFIMPFEDGTVLNIALGGKDVEAAFAEFRRNWWTVEMTRSVGVWHNAALTHRVLPIYDQGKDEMDCFMQEIDPIRPREEPPPSPQHSLACGD